MVTFYLSFTVSEEFAQLILGQTDPHTYSTTVSQLTPIVITPGHPVLL